MNSYATRVLMLALGLAASGATAAALAQDPRTDPRPGLLQRTHDAPGSDHPATGGVDAANYFGLASCLVRSAE